MCFGIKAEAMLFVLHKDEMNYVRRLREWLENIGREAARL